MKYLKYVFLVLYIFCTIIIVNKSFEDGEKSTETSDQVTDTIVDAIEQITPGDEPITDKFDIEDIKTWVRKGIGHFGLFAVLGIFATLTYYFFIKRKLFAIITILVSGILTACISEFIQIFKDGRVGSFSDILLDFCGFCTTFAIIAIILLIYYFIQVKLH